MIQGELAKLVESEQQLDAELSAARADAAAIVAAAREAAAAGDRRQDEAIATAVAALGASLEAEERAAAASIGTECVRDVERYDGARDDVLGQLVRRVVERLVRGGAA